MTSIEFASDAWAKAVMAELNRSESYRQAARHWEGDICFVVQSGVDLPQPVSLYMDLWHGGCREACRLEAGQSLTPAFVIEAPLSIWRRVLEKRLDPLQAIVMRQLKLKGNVIKVMQAPRAAKELVECCTRVPTASPAEGR